MALSHLIWLFTIVYISLCTAQQSTVQVWKPIQAQRPAVARVGQSWSFQLMPDTFISPSNSALSISASNLPSWVDFTDGVFSGVAQQSDIGNTLVQITAVSPKDQPVSTSFHLFVSNGPTPYVELPVATQLPNATSLPAGCILHYDQSLRVPSNWSFSIGFEQYTFQDDEENPIYYSAYAANSANLPDWLTFDNSTVTFNGVAPEAGVFPIVLLGSNVFGYGDVSQMFTITVSGHQFDLVTPLAPITAGSQGTVNYTIPLSALTIDNIHAVSANISAISVDLSAYPGLSYDANAHTLSGQLTSTNGSGNITVEFTDSYGDTLSTSISVNTNSSTSTDSSLFTTTAIPGISLRPGQSIDRSLSPFYSDVNAQYSATIQPASVSWLHYVSTNQSLVGAVPSNISQPINITITITGRDARSNSTQTATLPVTVSSSRLIGNKTGLSHTAIIALASSLGSFAGIAALLGLCLCRRRRRRIQSNSSIALYEESSYAQDSTKKNSERVTVREVGENPAVRPSTRYIRSTTERSLDAQPVGLFNIAKAPLNRSPSGASLGLGIQAPSVTSADELGFSTFQPQGSISSDVDNGSWGSQASSRFSRDLFYPDAEPADDDRSSGSVQLASTPKRRREFQKPAPLDLAAARKLPDIPTSNPGSANLLLQSPRFSAHPPGVAALPLSAPAFSAGKSPRSIYRPSLSPRIGPVPFAAPIAHDAYGSPVVASPRMDTSPLLSAGATWRFSQTPAFSPSSTPWTEDAQVRSRFSVSSVAYSAPGRPDSEIIDYIR